tara:strand:+ start:1262 stop:1468 length:207 start_codon:yes stop_codon:yes gene_type:complete
MVKDLEYYRLNCEENYLHTPISVLRYIKELEKNNEKVKSVVSELRDIAWDNATDNFTYTRINDLLEDV